MIYLIDGHNLIGKMPDIDLADPDDEEKLIRRLQNWAGLSRKRRVHVVFDPGPIGGFGDLMGGLGVQVQFARMGQIADTVLIKILREIRNPQEVTVVTSDRAILDVARKRRIGYILSEEFALMMVEEAAAQARGAQEPPAAVDPGEGDEIDLSAAEVAEWLAVFDQAPRPTRPSRQPAKPAPKKSAKIAPPALPPPTVDELKEGVGALSDDDVAAWLDLFEEASSSPAASEEPAEPPTGRQPAPTKRKKKKGNPDPPSKAQKYDDGHLSEAEIDEWLDLFGESEGPTKPS